MDLLKNNFRLFCIGPSEVGKTDLIVKILLDKNAITPRRGDIIICYSNMQPAYNKLFAKYGREHVHLINGFDDQIMQESYLKNMNRPLLWIDDSLEFFRDSSGRKLLEKLLTRISHHSSLACILTYQTLYTGTSSINAQCTHYIIKRLNDHGNFSSFARRIVGPENAKAFEKLYRKTTDDDPYGYIYIAMNQKHKALQIRSNILSEKYPFHQIIHTLKIPSSRVFEEERRDQSSSSLLTDGEKSA